MSDFLSLLPPNATDFERDMEQATSRLGEVPVRIRDYWNADAIPEQLMPWLGWEWSVDSWDSHWSLATKRNLLRNSFHYHSRKGTRKSVESAIRALGSHIAIKEWWQYDPQSTAHTFDAVIDASTGASTGVLQEQLIAAINNAKPVRSHYTITVASASDGAINLYGFGRVARFQRLTFHDA